MKYLYIITYEKIHRSSGYATDESGIRALALEWYWTGWEGRKTDVGVILDMEAMTVSVGEHNDAITYDILRFVEKP
jgi:hypothetical protein